MQDFKFDPVQGLAFCKVVHDFRKFRVMQCYSPDYSDYFEVQSKVPPRLGLTAVLAGPQERSIFLSETSFATSV